MDQAFTFVRSFSRQQDLNMFVADCWPNSPCGYSKYSHGFHLIPKPEDPDHISAILALCREQEIDVLLPVQHDEVIEVAKYKESFEQAGIRVPVPPYPLVELAVDKHRMAKLAKEHGISTPETYLVSEIDLSDVEPKIGFPLLTKLRSSTGQRGQKRVHDLAELQSHLRVLLREYPEDEIILQEHIPGTVQDTMYTVGLIYNHNYELRACVPLKKIRSRPFTGGTAICTRAEDRRDVREMAVGLMNCLGSWEGIADVEIKVDPRDGQPKFIELNPRPWGSMYGAFVAGVDLPRLWVEVAMREDFDPIDDFKEGIYASFLTRDLLLLKEITAKLFSKSRKQVWPVFRTFVWPYLRKGKKSDTYATADFALDDLEPFRKNIHRVRQNLLPRILMKQSD